MESIRNIYGKLVNFLKSPNGIRLSVCLGLVGLLLLLLSDIGGNTSQDVQPTTTSENYSVEDYRADLETRLTDLISQVDGAGDTQVMVTLSTSERNIYAQEIKQQSKENGASEYQNTYVTINTGDGKTALLDTVQPPEILGVVVLCSGGSKGTVKENIYSIVSALTGLKASNIFVGQLG